MPRPIRPKQSLGQNFLTDPNVVDKIVRAVRASEASHVVEIGPGMGALTEALVRRYPQLTALEIDDRAVEYLRTSLPALDVRQADVLEVDWKQLAEEKDRPLYVVGNLPYYVTSQILFALMEARSVVEEAVLMMQLEVAQRLVAVPRTKAYGILSVQVQAHAHPDLLFRVSRNVFTPKPDVTSAMVRLTFSEAPVDRAGVSPAFFRTVVRTAFNQRRKMLRNSLGQWVKGQDIALPHDWGTRRAEELTPEQFLDLAQHLEDRSSGP